MAGKFFDVKYLMNMTDKQGNKPEIFIVCSKVRGPGKTTSVGKMIINKALETGEKFVLICRNQGDVGHYAEGCLKETVNLFFSDYRVEERVGSKGVYSSVYLIQSVYDEDGAEEATEEIHVGYVIALRAYGKIKNISSLFTDSWCTVQDEFIPADRRYLPDEPKMLLNLHQSLARGGGKSSRYYPHFMMANCIDIFNPYFADAFKLIGKIQSNTKKFCNGKIAFMRFESKGVIQEQKESTFNQAFEGYYDEAEYDDNSWMADDNSLCCKPDPKWGYVQYQYNLHDGDLWLRLAYYYSANIYMLDFGQEQGLTTFAMKDPEIGETSWAAPNRRIRIKLRQLFQSGQLLFRDERVKRAYLSRF